MSQLTPLERFAQRHRLTVLGERSHFGPGTDYYIHGLNGYAFEAEKPNMLRAGIVYLSTWERMRKEFRLSAAHCRILRTSFPGLQADDCIRVEFSADNDRQGRLVVELAQLQ
jgi:hypothetical protein